MSRLTAIISAIVICLVVCLGWLASHYHSNATEIKRQRDKATEQLSLANDTSPGVSKATSATGVDDAGAPELTPDAQRNYFDLRDGIATADKMIRGMQDYIKEQCLR